MLLVSALVLLQSAAIELPVPRGRIISDNTGKPVSGATVKLGSTWRKKSPFLTKEDGRFEFLEAETRTGIWCHTGEPRDREVWVSAAGFARMVVHPSLVSPLAMEVPLRETGSLGGTISGAEVWSVLRYTVQARDFVWPPGAPTDAVTESHVVGMNKDGRFRVPHAPRHTKLTFWIKQPSRPAEVALGEAVLGPETPPDLMLVVPMKVEVPARYDNGTEWQHLECIATTPAGTRNFGAWFDILPLSRRVEFTEAELRGRVNQDGVVSFAWTGIEAQPGEHTLVARDSEGFIGVAPLFLPAQSAGTVHRIAIERGGVVRIHVARNAAGRVSLSSKACEFAVREAIGDEFWYELVPAGSVEIRVATQGRVARTIHTVVASGELKRIEIAD